MDIQFLKNFECAICFGLFSDPITIPCGHTFCRQCILQAVKQMPRCPTCRQSITVELANYKENLQIKSAIQDLQSLTGKNTQEQRKQSTQEIFDQDTQSFILIITDANITPHLYQRIQLPQNQFKKLNLNQIKEIFKNIQKFGLSNKNSQIGYIAQLQQVQIVDGRIEAQLFCEQCFEIESINETEFSIENQFKYTLPVVQAKIIKEEYIDLQDKEIINQIQIILKCLRTTLEPYIKQLSVNNASKQYKDLYMFLVQNGLMIYLFLDVEKDYKSLNRLSYLLPSLLRISKEERLKINSQSNLIQRLILINQSVNQLSNRNKIKKLIIILN